MDRFPEQAAAGQERSYGLSSPCYLVNVQTMFLVAAASANGVEIDPGERCAAAVTAPEHSTLLHIPRRQYGRAEAMWPNCPQCGGQDLRIAPFDYGTCSQTGYRDAGERWECRRCGAVGDGEELNPQRGRTSGMTVGSLDATQPPCCQPLRGDHFK